MKNLNRASFRSKANYWAAVASEVAGAPFRRWQKEPPALERWRRGILIGCDHIGDVLYNTASLPTLARATPQCEWTYAVSRPADQVLETNPHLRGGLLRLPVETGKMPWRELVGLLRAGRFDVAICYDSSSYLRNALAAAAAGIPERIGYVHKGFSCLPTRPVRIDYPQPFPCYFRDLVAQVTGLQPPREPRPEVYATPEDEAAADAVLEAKGVRGEHLIACSLFTRQASGVYAPHYFIEALRRVQAASDVRVVFVGAAAEREALARLVEGSGLRHIVVAGDLTVRGSYALLRRCRAALTTDSGIRHLSNAAGIPVVYPRNLYFSRAEAGPYCSTDHDIAPSEGGNAELIDGGGLSFDPAQAAETLLRLLA
jgi:ADP-heptose:LPS heptosyltransferase